MIKFIKRNDVWLAIFCLFIFGFVADMGVM